MEFNETRDDWVAVASAGPDTNHLHAACSLHAVARPSVCLSSVMLVHPTQAVVIFGNFLSYRPHALPDVQNTEGKCQDQVLTVNQCPEFVPDPLSGRRLWPAGQRQMPVTADRRQQTEGPVLRAPRPAGLVRTAIIVVLKVPRVQHQERSHQDRFQHLQRQITQLQQLQHHNNNNDTEGKK